jgi:hypothetical protein
MKKRKVIAHKNTAPSLRMVFFAVVWLLMDRLQPPSWAWGVVGTICVLLAIATLVDIFCCEQVDLFDKSDRN